MTRIDYIAIPEDTADARNDLFFEDISRNWKKKAKDLQSRRWEKIENKEQA